jgi:hypothetical protein
MTAMKPAKSYQETILSWPQLRVLDPSALRGRVVHKVYRHDNWCRTLNGGKASDCNCSPTVSLHLQPKNLDNE